MSLNKKDLALTQKINAQLNPTTHMAVQKTMSHQDISRLPAVKDLMNRVRRDKKIEKYIQDQFRAYFDWNKNQPAVSPGMGRILGDEFNASLLEHADRAVQKAFIILQDQSGLDEDDLLDALDAEVISWLNREYPDRVQDQILSEMAADHVDQMDYEWYPSGYHGVRNRDFLAGGREETKKAAALEQKLFGA